MSRVQFAVSAALLCVTFVGCGGQSSNQYGASSGLAGRSSLNGFGALRKSYEQAGYSTRDLYRLTDRVGRSQVIVWIPKVPQSISPKVTRWFDRWLQRGGRTLVYIAPDSGSETQYWEDASVLAPPEQRLEYRRRLARSRSERMRWTINRRTIPTNGWFVLEPASQRSAIPSLSGDWAPVEVTSQRRLLTEYRVVSFDPNQPSGSGGASSGGTGPGSPGYVYYGPTELSRTKVSLDSQLNTETGDTIVAQVTADKWKDSKIIVVSGGSLLTNYAFTRPFGVWLAETLVARSAPSPIGKVSSSVTAGFLTSDMMPIPVSERQRGVPQASGMELLTVWPISLVTIHAAALGFVICMIMLPVFGRPRRIDRGTSSNFGDHLDAVAALMSRAGGETFARAKISEYFRRMHGETSGPWILPETPALEVLPPLAGANRSVSTKPPGESVKPVDDVFGQANDVFAPQQAENSAGAMESSDGSLGSNLGGNGSTMLPGKDFDNDKANR